jgi:hypothetical protein
LAGNPYGRKGKFNPVLVEGFLDPELFRARAALRVQSLSRTRVARSEPPVRSRRVPVCFCAATRWPPSPAIGIAAAWHWSYSSTVPPQPCAASGVYVWISVNFAIRTIS